ncbi:hypothetical protein NDU88_006294 [Pleurodeles waltl]|uniref:Uncharacterized protein n=1 Tax=Pleurodeles waltl TaxID=8319 RepID=A0AAV7X196_PLEWA|nr:hypothetical protein NDU88_006294 [Pleurodeles waltl]
MALECPRGIHWSILPQFLPWHDDVRRDDGVGGEYVEAGTKRIKEVYGTESGSENEDYREEIERNAITKLDDKKGNRGDQREKTPGPDCRNEERRAPTEREGGQRRSLPRSLRSMAPTGTESRRWFNRKFKWEGAGNVYEGRVIEACTAQTV